MEFTSETQFASFIYDKGGNSYLVGGAVRDFFLGKESQDKDYVITGLNIEDLPFKKIAGKKFPVFLVKIAGVTCEIAMARKERKIGTGHKAFEFHADSSVLLEEDLERRDLTINSMAIDLLTDELFDPFGGNMDLRAKVLEHTSDAFSEDPLRVFRVARFFSTLEDFHVAMSTKILMKTMTEELKSLSAERVWEETKKALDSPTPSKFFKLLKEVDCLDHFFPELAALDVPDKHDGTAFLHTMKVLDFGFDLKTRFGLLVHDFGKGVTPKEDHPSHFGHDQLGVEEVKRFSERLKVPVKLKKFGMLCSAEHMRLKRADEMRPGKFIKMVLSQKHAINDLMKVSFLDSFFRDGADKDKEYFQFKKVSDLVDMVLEVEKAFTGVDLIERGAEVNKFFADKLLQERIRLFKMKRKEK